MRKKTSFNETFAWAPGSFKRRKRTSAFALFARAIANRYLGRTESVWRMFGAVLRRSMPGVTIEVNRREGDWHIAPCLKLVMLIWKEATGKMRAGNALEPAMRPTLANDEALLRTRTRLSPPESPGTNRLIRHLMSRRERKDSREAIPFRSATTLIGQSLKARILPKQLEEQPPMTTLKRLHPPLALSGQDSGSPHSGRQSSEPQPIQSSRVAKLRSAEAPLDVNHLAERVIQAIDRRIIAQRERLGRV